MAKAGTKKQPKKPAAAGGRIRKLSKKQSKAKVKKEVKTRQPLSGAVKLAGRAGTILWKNWRILGGIVLIYLILNIIFSSGISNINSTFASIKTNLNVGGGWWRAAAGFGVLVGSAGASSSAIGSTFQSALFIIESLVIIWALRHILSGQAVSIKLSYYKSMTPLIPFLLVIAMIIIQLLPVTVGATVLAAVSTSIFTDTGVATTVSAIVFVLLAAWSIYMVSASVFALYIVTLPDMQPLQALRSAKDLVRFRRWAIIRKVFFLPILIMVVMGVIIIPLILYASSIVPGVFYVLSMLAILFVHTYLYSLYRELLA